MNVGTVYVKDNGAVAADLRVITSGMVGATVRFVFDSSWEGYSKTLVWKAGDVTKDDTTASGVIPAEVLEVPGERLVVGVYGVKDGVVTPTLYAKLGPILTGADPSGDESTDPSLPVWVQLGQRVKDLEENSTGGGGGAFAEIIDGVLCVGGGKIVAEIENNVLCVK